jgi:arsenate reductase
MYLSIQNYCSELVTHFDEINAERKLLLQKVADYIQQKNSSGQPTQLLYVCTHNSRRSHFGQVWAAVAANYFNVKQVSSFSGGTETTAFHPNAINALKRIGFTINTKDESKANPVYTVQFGDELSTTCFSKVYDNTANPERQFAAVMTCSDADENCPFIPGVELRIGTTYEDPKAFDNTLQQDTQYDTRCRQIALETLYVFSLVQ